MIFVGMFLLLFIGALCVADVLIAWVSGARRSDDRVRRLAYAGARCEKRAS